MITVYILIYSIGICTGRQERQLTPFWKVAGQRYMSVHANFDNICTSIIFVWPLLLLEQNTHTHSSQQLSWCSDTHREERILVTRVGIGICVMWQTKTKSCSMLEQCSWTSNAQGSNRQIKSRERWTSGCFKQWQEAVIFWKILKMFTRTSSLTRPTWLNRSLQHWTFYRCCLSVSHSVCKQDYCKSDEPI